MTLFLHYYCKKCNTSVTLLLGSRLCFSQAVRILVKTQGPSPYPHVWLLFYYPLRIQNIRARFIIIQACCYWMHICVPDAQWGQTNRNVWVWSRERFIAGPCKETRLAHALKTPNSPMVFREGEVFTGKIWDESCRVCDFLLIGWWWGNRAAFQESCAQPEVTILHLGGGLSSCRRTQRCWEVYSFWRNLDTIVSWLLLLCFCIPSHPWLATVWICRLVFWKV